MIYCTECGAPVGGVTHRHEAEAPDGSMLGRIGGAAPLLALALAVLALVLGGLAMAQPSGVSDEELDTLLAQRLAELAPRDDVGALAGRVDALSVESDAMASEVERLGEVIDAPAPLTVSEIADRAQASVVTVTTPRGLGTGFAVEDPTGDVYVITNYHVVESVWVGGGREVEIVYGDVEQTARIVNVSLEHDLAAIGPVDSIAPLPTSRDLPEVGEDVVVIGSPYGLDGTVVTGVVSAHREDDERIQFSAPVSPGNSGGPLIDSEGVVVGVVVEKVNTQEAEGLSFAIPMDAVCRVIVAC